MYAIESRKVKKNISRIQINMRPMMASIYAGIPEIER
jgi:hypothetical protein